MKKQISVKKKLNNFLLKKKLTLNNFALIVENSLTTKETYNKNYFTKNALNENYIIKISHTIKLHFPLNVYFFKTFKAYKTFIKIYFKEINILKIQNKFLQKTGLNFFFFSSTQTNFLNLNCFFFFS